ncbi:hypothetical protein GQ44DRAFT_107697 [Phaeosphaeriaceae sp. PMI808]|nr:hypothetical protein GQ44DRAFT_107697 [Phaeosphaeriaceae sp. PMI808]
MRQARTASYRGSLSPGKRSRRPYSGPGQTRRLVETAYQHGCGGSCGRCWGTRSRPSSPAHFWDLPVSQSPDFWARRHVVVRPFDIERRFEVGSVHRYHHQLLSPTCATTAVMHHLSVCKKAPGLPVQDEVKAGQRRIVVERVLRLPASPHVSLEDSKLLIHDVGVQGFCLSPFRIQGTCGWKPGGP